MISCLTARKKRQDRLKNDFPEGLPKLKPYDLNELSQAITNSTPTDIEAALRKEQNDTPICKTLNAFRISFTALAMKETYFNPQHLINALDVLCQKFFTWTQEQRSLFFCQVIGYIQRFLPACYAQVLCQGLFHARKHKPNARSLKFNHKHCSKLYFPLPQGQKGLGFDFGFFSGWRAQGEDARTTTKHELQLFRKALNELHRARAKELKLLHLECRVKKNDTLKSPTRITVS